MRNLERWPLLLAASALGAVAAGMEWADDGARLIGVACAVLAAASLGAFIYSEGVRHRDTPGDTPRTGHTPDDPT